MKVYLITSLRNPGVADLGNRIRALGFDVFDDWWAAGPEADDCWQRYEQIRQRTYGEALYDRYAAHIFEFDREHLDSSDIGILVLPCGKSGHLELGYLIGQGKSTYVLFEGEPERYDVMYRFAKQVFFAENELLRALAQEAGQWVT